MMIIRIPNVGTCVRSTKTDSEVDEGDMVNLVGRGSVLLGQD